MISLIGINIYMAIEGNGLW